MIELATAPDALLARRAADGDERAFGAIVRRHAPYLRAFARRLGSLDLDVDDVVQESFIVAWRSLPSLADPERLRGWLTTIVSRKVIDRSRTRRPQVELDETTAPTVAESDGPEARAESNDRLSALAIVLRALPEEQRQVWVLKEIAGEPYEAIAAQLEIPVSTVRGRLARARATVLEKMRGWE